MTLSGAKSKGAPVLGPQAALDGSTWETSGKCLSKRDLGVFSQTKGGKKLVAEAPKDGHFWTKHS
jgi:hypothetical protein